MFKKLHLFGGAGYERAANERTLPPNLFYRYLFYTNLPFQACIIVTIKLNMPKFAQIAPILQKTID